MPAAAFASSFPDALVDLDRYPLHHLKSDRGRDPVDSALAQVARIGAAESPGKAVLLADARLEPLARRSGGMGTAYLDAPVANFPVDPEPDELSSGSG